MTQQEDQHPETREGPATYIGRGLSVVFHTIRKRLRWLWYNARAFAWYRPTPLDTVFYGRVTFSHLPVRVSIGHRSSIGDNVYLSTGRHAEIVLGENVTLNTGAMLVASRHIFIGDNVAVGEHVSFRDQEHRHSPESGVRGMGFVEEPIEIAENCWIGRGSFIGPGTILGAGCIVAAHSVVHGTFPPAVLIAGAPARIKRGLTPEAAEAHSVPLAASAAESTDGAAA